jgi:3-dehydroquinate dehydratase II
MFQYSKKKDKKMNILIINGPNLNLLGKREPSIYGNSTFEDYFSKLKQKFPEIALEYYQSNTEGQIIDKIQEYGFSCQGIILNAGGYTHTSVAIRDAIAGIKTPVVEVHISNTLSRENFRHQSMIGPVCRGCIMGFGLQSYDLAVEYLKNKMD